MGSIEGLDRFTLHCVHSHAVPVYCRRVRG